jgi:hypothetical protein
MPARSRWPGEGAPAYWPWLQVLRALDAVGLGPVFGTARRVERFSSTPDLPSVVRAASGPG